MPTMTAEPQSATRDPQAVALADGARNIARAAGLKSAYTSGEASDVLAHFAVTRERGVLTIVKDGGEPNRVRASTLRAYLAREKNDDTRAAAALMQTLSGDLHGMLYGRKMAAFLLALAD